MKILKCITALKNEVWRQTLCSSGDIAIYTIDTCNTGSGFVFLSHVSKAFPGIL